MVFTTDIMTHRLNIHIYSSEIRNETRIFKETSSIVRLGLTDKILIIGVLGQGLAQKELIDENREIYRVKLFMNRFRKSKIVDVLKFVEFLVVVVFRFVQRKPEYVNFHSLAVLPLAPFFKLFAKSYIIYDAHELETEKAGINGMLKKMSKISERFLVKFVDKIIVVSDSIAQWYKEAYPGKEIFVVRNIPHNSGAAVLHNNELKQRLGIKESEILFIYQGLINMGRGIQKLLDTFIELPEEKHILFMGFGKDTDSVNEYSKKYKNIHYHPAVPYNAIQKITAGADVGFSILDNSCLNHYFCLPNKFFEYILSGVPVIASNFPDMSKVIESTKFGWTSSPERGALLNLINSISIDEINIKKALIQNGHDQFGWQIEEKNYPLVFTKYK